MKKIKDNIWKIYTYFILKAMFFAVPILVLFWQDNGLTLTQIMLLQSIFAIITATLEIPSGYISDKYGRRNSLVIASLANFVGIVAIGLGQTFFQFFIGEIFFAISVSFVSGTLSALTFDTLKELNREKEYKKIWGNMVFYGLVSLAISNILGSVIAKIDLRYALYASIPFFALIIPLTFSLIEPPKHYKKIQEKSHLKEILAIFKTTFIKNKLKWILIYSGIVFTFTQSAFWIYQPYFKLSGLDIAYFGIVFASFQLVAAFSSKYAHRLEEILGQKYSLAMLLFLISISFLLMHNFIFLFSFSFAFIQQFIRGFKEIIISDYINNLVESHKRATVLSIDSFIGRLLYASILPIIGWIADIYTLEQALLFLTILTFILTFFSLIILRKVKLI